MKFYQSGRSMVEMLGVLAIIGVLSVGAISGYSKAMMKYKLNKQAEQYSDLMAAIYTYKDKLKNHSINDVLSYLNVLNLLPEYFTKKAAYYNDSFGNSMKCNAIYTEGCASYSAGCNYINCSIYLEPNSYALQACQNILNTVKSNSNILWFANMHNSTSEGATDQINTTYGDEFCNPAKQSCLRDLSVSTIYDFCAACSSDKYTSCTLRFTFY